MTDALREEFRAVLIQDVRELTETLHRALAQAWVSRRAHDYETVVLWLIQQYLREHHGLIDPYHDFEHKTLRQISVCLDDYLHCSLEVLLKFYVKAPVLYNPVREVYVEIRGQSLYLWYYDVLK